MNQTSTINLIQTKTATAPETEFVRILSRIATVAVVIVIMLGAAASGFFYYFYTRQQQLSGQQASLSAAVAADKVKESLLLVIKKRVATVNNILSLQKNWSAGFDILNAVLGGSTITSISVNEESKVVVQFTAKSLDEVIGIVDSVKREVEAKHLRDPELVSLTLDKNNNFAVSLRFTGLF